MSDHEQSCRRLLMKWCEHKAKEERKLIGRCRSAYRDPTLAHLTNRYADTLEAAAKLFDDLRAEIEQPEMDDGTSDGPSAIEANDILGKPGHYK